MSTIMKKNVSKTLLFFVNSIICWSCESCRSLLCHCNTCTHCQFTCMLKSSSCHHLLKISQGLHMHLTHFSLGKDWVQCTGALDPSYSLFHLAGQHKQTSHMLEKIHGQHLKFSPFFLQGYWLMSFYFLLVSSEV